MRSVADFYQDCLAIAQQQAPLDLLLADSVSCVAAVDVIAPYDHPSADLAALDGYAVRAADVAGASRSNPVSLAVTAQIEAGDSNPAGLATGGAARIASGAPLPLGADAVVPLADTNQGQIEVDVMSACTAGGNVAPMGSDIRAGSVVVPRLTRLGPAQIAAIAAAGVARVVVHPRPRVVIISVGDELIEPGSRPRAGSVFDANGLSLAAAAEDAGAETFRCSAVEDDRVALRELIDDQLMRADLVITTGGLSHGSGNTVREVLSPLGTVRFERVASTPGSILGVGTVNVEADEATQPVPVFCLPGNPVAAQVCFEVFVRPALRKMQGWKKLNRPSVRAQIDREFTSPVGVRQFFPVRLKGDPKVGYVASPQGPAAGGKVSALAASNALAVVPEDTTSVPAGTVLTCMLLD